MTDAHRELNEEADRLCDDLGADWTRREHRLVYLALKRARQRGIREAFWAVYTLVDAPGEAIEALRRRALRHRSGEK